MKDLSAAELRSIAIKLTTCIPYSDKESRDMARRLFDTAGLLEGMSRKRRTGDGVMMTTYEIDRAKMIIDALRGWKDIDDALADEKSNAAQFSVGVSKFTGKDDEISDVIGFIAFDYETAKKVADIIKATLQDELIKLGVQAEMDTLYKGTVPLR